MTSPNISLRLVKGGKDKVFGRLDHQFQPSEEKYNQTSIKEVTEMDDNKILEKYIESVDKDRREMEKRITENKRESEERLQKELRQRENRFEELSKMQYQDNKEREERYHNLAKEIKEENKDFKSDIKQDLQHIHDELSLTKNEISNLIKHNESLATTNKWSNIATIIGISTIVVSIIVALITFFIMI